ncbi:MAG: DEAD/DEAH box helicase [Caulobacter sp.]|nr:DEAD/DEAH box helicase [Caulobacter sp.]
MAFPPLNPAIERALAAQGYADPTPVQLAVLEEHAVDRDLLVSAQTGSGKTVAFGVAMATTLLGEEQYLGGVSGAPMALIIAPTRELALQVSRELEWLYKEAGGRIVTCVGGMDARREQRLLAGGCHIVVGTPGRLRDHLERGYLDVSALKVAVLDEADEMLDLGFREDLEFILETTPAERRTLLFSATIAKDIARLAQTYQRDAVRIDTTTRNEPHGDIEYKAIRVAPNEIEHAVVNVLRHYHAGGALVFCSTRDAVRHLYASLRERGFEVVGLSGEMGQRERNDALQALRDRRARVCVATDVAARGLDLPDLGLVIHADLPVNKATLLHRSGRTGRAGKKGTSVLLVPYTRRRKAESLLASASIEAEWVGPPSADEIRAGDQRRMLEDPTLTEPATEEDLGLARILMDQSPAEAIAVALLRMYRARLPEPEDLYDGGPFKEHGAKPRIVREGDSDRGGLGNSFEDRGPRDHTEFADATWFKLSIGRAKNADPKWLLPLICRIGVVTKKDIGQIRIFDNETKFQISEEMSGKFMEQVLAHPDKDVRVEPSTAPTSKDFAPRKPRAAGYGDRAERGDRPDRGDRPQRTERPAWKDKAPRADAGADRPARPEWKDKAPRPERSERPAPRADSADRPARPEWKDKPARAERPAAPRAEGAARPAWKDKPERSAPRTERAAPAARAEKPAYSEKPEWKPRPPRDDPRPAGAPARAPRDSGARESVPYNPATPAPEKPFRKPRATGGAFKPGGEFKGGAFKGPKAADGRGGSKPFKPAGPGGPKKPFKGKPRP